MNVSRRIALTLIAGMALGAIATGPAPASQLQVVPGVPAVDVIPKPARYSGTHGLRVAITDTNAAYVQDNSPLNEKEYRVRFYVNLNGLTMASGDKFNLFEGWDADGLDTAGVIALRAEIHNAAGNQLNVCIRDNAAAEACLLDTAGEQLLKPGWHLIELDFINDAFDSNNGNNNGQVRIWVDGKIVATAAGMSTVDNDARSIDYVRLGAASGIDAGMVGPVPAIGPPVVNGSTLRIDDFVSQRANYIGPLSNFTDVASSNGLWPFIESIYSAGITAGSSCLPAVAPSYCPSALVSRQAMAVFLLVARHGELYSPPACAADITFGDVPCADGTTTGFGPWIEQVAREGITAGCGGGNYCPTSSVSRQAMAVFLLVAEHGAPYSVPACAADITFADVPCADGTTTGFGPFIEQVAREGITAGCGGGNYCPTAAVGRGSMAVFLQATFQLHKQCFSDVDPGEGCL